MIARQPLVTEEFEAFGPWNPGIESALPESFLPLSTVFCASNVTSTLAEVRELSDVCGLAIERLSAFRAERLALHEVLIRVMADLSVPDGDKYEDLGVNFRRMTATILDKHVTPVMPQINEAFGRLTQETAARVDQIQRSVPFPSSAARETTPANVARWSWQRFFPQSAAASRGPPPAPHAEIGDLARLDSWRAMTIAADQPFEQACLRALVTAGDAIIGKRGRIPHDRSLLTALATRLVCNDYGSLVIGETIDRYFAQAASREGYRILPAQLHPIVMNVKGASASGKSTMRPLQKKLALRLGVDWADFALMSPDIWRKYLLDYGSLGAARRYAGTLTGHEVAIIDKKLDRYMARKAKAGRMSHLLIDRFRFDSFAGETDEEEGGKLLTRFGDEIYMFFMITPPEATVERAWSRGEQVGRYKAVEDLLAHNVEAYSGIPGLFFTWASRADKKVHFEFLDNSVPEGTRPRTVAFGTNGRMNVLDVACLLSIDRYRTIDVTARSAEAIYPLTSPSSPGHSAEFLKNCLRRIPEINFADHHTGQVYARIETGKVTWWRRDLLEAAERDPRVRAVFEDLVAGARTASEDRSCAPELVDSRQTTTLGRWGMAGEIKTGNS
jgi:hypothetical protein